jgi:hypothetical protein
MLANLARGAYLVLVVAMLAAYAASAVRAPALDPTPKKPAERIYS